MENHRYISVAFRMKLVISLIALLPSLSLARYTWKNVKIGGGGGFIPGIVFNPSEQGLAYVRTDIGGAYKLNSDDTWSPLLDFVDNGRWNYWGVDALATDPIETNRLYLATGMYTNDWDPNNGQILISEDYGASFTVSELPFKVGGNMPGRGMGERLVVDPNSNNILLFGARSGNGLYTSLDYGRSWSHVSGLSSVGNYAPDPTDSTGYNNDLIGIAWVTFDASSGAAGSATPRIFVGVASNGTDNIFVSEDAGSSWDALDGQQTTYFPHKGVISPAEGVLYITYSDGAGPYDGTLGSVWKYDIAGSNWTDITPVTGADLYFGFGGLAVDAQKPGTVMVAALNSWWPDGQIYRSTDRCGRAHSVRSYTYPTSSGSTWSPFWDWAHIRQSTSITRTPTTWHHGWVLIIAALAIDPFDSDHLLYGTGATLYGSRDLTKWDTVHNISLSSCADGIEETAVQALISPKSGPSLISGVGDIEGFVHEDLDALPGNYFTNPTWVTTIDLDFAGNKPPIFSTGKQVALSTDSGATWSQDYGASDDVHGDKVALSADGDTVLWRTVSNGITVSRYTNSFTAVSSLPSTAIIASDKVNNSVFYAADSSSFYVSTDNGNSFTTAGSLGSTSSPVKIIANLDATGDVWISTNSGLLHSTDMGATFEKISSVSQAWSIALGASATDGGYPAVFAAASINGTTWTQINDDTVGFGAFSANVLAADPRVYGRVYIGTNGRGIFYGDIS
ncbi:glycoside hydrolase family 74 protein [Mucidula mucida]|nr:glycoside hydrolase family 74 protein [Mucidula mucida]